jgi:hypothetical protein
MEPQVNPPTDRAEEPKKELVGNYANGGVEWQPAGEPEQVLMHDFPDPKVGKAIPYGLYDLGAGTRLGECGLRP